jgi:hypothetical protein
MLRFKNFTITDTGNSIFRIVVFEGAELDIEDAMLMKAGALQLANGNRYAILVDGSKAFTVSPEVRKLIASFEYSPERLAGAFVTTSLANRLIGNFFIKFNKPASPTKLFSDEASAIEWLNEQIESSRYKSDNFNAVLDESDYIK